MTHSAEGCCCYGKSRENQSSSHPRRITYVIIMYPHLKNKKIAVNIPMYNISAITAKTLTLHNLRVMNSYFCGVLVLVVGASTSGSPFALFSSAEDWEGGEHIQELRGMCLGYAAAWSIKNITPRHLPSAQ